MRRSLQPLVHSLWLSLRNRWEREGRHAISIGATAVLIVVDIVEHHADRAAPLIEGRIAREWTRADLLALRVQGGNALEEAVSA